MLFFPISGIIDIFTYARTNTHAHTGVQFLLTKIMSTGSTKLPVNPYRTKCICYWDDSLEALHSFIFYYLTSHVVGEVALKSRGCYQSVMIVFWYVNVKIVCMSIVVLKVKL